MPTERIDERPHTRHDRSLPELLGDLSRETIDLVRQEVALARAEVSEKVTSAQNGVKAMAGGAVVAMGGFVVLLIAIANLLAEWLPADFANWLAPLIVGGVALLIGWGMLKGGSTKLEADKLKPHRTMASLRQDKLTAQEKFR